MTLQVGITLSNIYGRFKKRKIFRGMILCDWRYKHISEGQRQVSAKTPTIPRQFCINCVTIPLSIFMFMEYTLGVSLQDQELET